MNIVLIGYRGTGKSVVGNLLAEKLKMSYYTMDAMIVERAGMPVPEIVEKFGWPGFRDRETELARELAALDGVIIDCGGGIIERPENIEVLRINGVIIWLTATVETIVNRIQGDTNRPSLTGGKSFTDEVAEVLARRTPIYKAAAHHTIETDNLTPEEIVERISGLLLV
ncbi:MAG: shikimate kinase [bacterium]